MAQQTIDLPRELGPAMTQAAQEVGDLLGDLLAPMDTVERRVVEAMRYGVLGGGKRLRPFLVLASCQLFNVSHRSALRVAAAVECVHNYALIHDDLPAMDDSDLRRGQPTVHQAYDPATAVLAGDGLLTFAFEILGGGATHSDPAVRSTLVQDLAKAAGAHGMVGGQQLDLIAEREAFDIGAITRLQRLKTGALIAFACESAPIMAKAPHNQRQAIHAYAQDLGLAFQIADDLLDYEGSSERTGKATGQDAAAGKQTFVSVLGPERARTQAHLLAEQAQRHLDIFDVLEAGEDRASLLRQAARFVVERDG